MPGNLSSFLFSGALAFFICGGVLGTFHLWHSSLQIAIPSARHSMLVSALILAAAASLSRFRWRELGSNQQGWACGLAFVFFSDWLCRPYNLFQGPAVRGEILLLSLFALLALRHLRPAFFSWYAIASILGLSLCFLWHSAGRVLFSDDHPTFMYRLQLLKENFPSLPFYYPLWNGGIEARDFFATGALNVYFLSAPMLYAFDIWQVYNWVILLLLFGLVPLASFLGATIQKLPTPGPALCVILSLSASLLWYRWGLKYGTAGFITTAALIPLNLCLTLKLFSAGKEFSPREAFLYVVSMTLMLFWTPSALVFAPLAMAALIYCRTLLAKRFFVPIVLSLLLLNIPWMALFWSVSNVSQFLKSEKPIYQIDQEDYAPEAAVGPAVPYRMKAAGLDLNKSLKILRQTAISTNPLLIFLALPGVLAMAWRPRLLMLATLGWLLLMGSLAAPFKPQLELDRTLLIMALCACLPAAAALQSLLQDLKRSWHYRLLPALCFGFLLCGPFAAGSIVLNRTVEQYHFAQPIVEELSAAIKTHGGMGRTLFSGFILHHLSEGHVAPLTHLSGKPLIASSPYHNVWRYTQVIPDSFLKRGDAGIEEYLDLYNISSIVAHERIWRNYFLQRSDKYRLVWQKNNFLLFKRLAFPDTYFYQGKGRLIDQNSNSLVLEAHSPEVVLKFNYLPFLNTSRCNVSALEVAPGISFIKLRDCPVDYPVVIKSVPPWRRLLGGFN